MDVAATLSDPLTLLREFTVAKEAVLLVGEHIVFGRVRCVDSPPWLGASPALPFHTAQR